MPTIAPVLSPRSPPGIAGSPGADPAGWSRDPRTPDPRKNPGRTLLMEAARANDPEAVRALLPLSDLAAEDNQGRTALIHAVESEALGDGCVELLLPHSNPEHRWASGMTALMSAVQNGDLTKVNRLWDVSTVDAVSEHGYTLLMLAAWMPGRLELLERVAPVCDANAVSHDGRNVLHQAYHNPRGLAWLIAQGLGDPHQRDLDGRTPLMCVALMGPPETVEALLPVSDVMALDGKGQTALEIAVAANKWRNARPLAMVMPAATVQALVQHRRGKAPRALERRVVEAEQAALRAVLDEPAVLAAMDRALPPLPRSRARL